MSLYILLARLSDDGQQKMLENRGRLNDIIRKVNVPGAEILARYAVLGRFDFILMAEARDHDAIARLSLELGGRAGLHFETLPAIPMGVLTEPAEEGSRPTADYEQEPTGA